MASNLDTLIDYGTGLLQRNSALIENPGREAATKGWQAWIKSATGEEAILVRQPDKNVLQWKPGQAEKFSKYFDSMVFGPKETGKTETRGYGFGEVEINWKPVYMPLVLKRVLPVVGAYTLLAIAAGWGITKLVGGKKR